MIDFLGLIVEMWKKRLLENIRKILGSKIVQVKELMPPEDGISQETPTGRAVGWNVVWHNFLCCSDICYTFARLYLFCRITENRKSSMAVVANLKWIHNLKNIYFQFLHHVIYLIFKIACYNNILTASPQITKQISNIFYILAFPNIVRFNI